MTSPSRGQTSPTPGPWENENGRIRHGGYLIATVSRARRLGDSEWNANARLIASAPTMEALLVECATMLDASRVFPSIEDRADLIERIDAALSSPRGASSDAR